MNKMTKMTKVTKMTKMANNYTRDPIPERALLTSHYDKGVYSILGLLVYITIIFL